MTWNPQRYLTFAELRTRPSHDLAARVDLASPRRIVDLGCGPGNSTHVCATRWPGAAVLGIDSSPAMIETARATYPDIEWRVADLAEWVQEMCDEPFDVIFSSAALQWVGDHAMLFPRLLEHLAPGGVLAVQMPAYDALPNRVMRELAASDGWRAWFPEGRGREWRSHELEFYYDVLAPHAARLDLFAIEYLQVLPEFHSIIDWYRGTGLRPYLEAIGDEGERERFLGEFAARLRPSYPDSAAGGVPFPFRRLFVVACK